MTPVENNKILIVGAGPVGLFLALKLAQAGIPAEVIEREDSLSEAPRAAGYYAGALQAISDAGLAKELAQIGFIGQGLGWVKPPVPEANGGTRHGDLVAQIPFPEGTRENPEKGMLILPQYKFCKFLVNKLNDYPDLIRVRFGLALSHIEDDGQSITATLKTASGETETFKGSFLVGADGGKSTTRKLLGIALNGHTWPERLIATDVLVKNDTEVLHPTRFLIHPLHYAAIIPLEEPVLGKESLWRYAISLDPKDDRPDEEVLSDASLRELYRLTMAGPKDLQYSVQRKATYRVHQRCAASMRRGRCVLAGDAAHLNAPFGAMGLSTGLLDADCLAEAFKCIIQEDHSLSSLDVYSDERRRVFQFFVDPNTTQNKIRLANDPDKAGEDDWFLREMKDPSPAKVYSFILPFINTWRTDFRKVVADRAAFSAA